MILAQKRTASENKELQLYNQKEHIYIYSIFYKKKKTMVYVICDEKQEPCFYKKKEKHCDQQ